MAIGGGVKFISQTLKYLSFTLWIYKKKGQVWLRTHLSHALAISLAGLAFYREWDDLVRMAYAVYDWQQITQPAQSGHFGFLEILILIIILATVGAAIWEIWGNKLTTSPQEIRFVTAMRVLLYESEKFIYSKDRDNEDPDVRLEQFIDLFLSVTCNTLCGKTSVEGGVMLETPAGDEIALFQWSKNANYPNELVIPIPNQNRNQETGPAGFAYQLQTLVYMPKKNKRLGWPFTFDNDAYQPAEPAEGWISVDPPYEKFRSVLCIPIAIYQRRNPETQKDVKTPLGVLNYSTNSPDPFVDRDFVMGECFSSILAHVLEAYRTEREQRARIRPEGSSAPSAENGGSAG